MASKQNKTLRQQSDKRVPNSEKGLFKRRVATNRNKYFLYFKITSMALLITIAALTVYNIYSRLSVINYVDIIDTLLQKTKPAGIQIETSIKGNNFCNAKTILGLVSEKSFLKINPYLLKQNIIKLPWIKNVIISKKMPNKLNIIIEEHNPFAICCTSLNNKNYNIIDRNNNIIAQLIRPNGDIKPNFQKIKVLQQKKSFQGANQLTDQSLQKLSTLPVIYGEINIKNCSQISLFRNYDFIWSKVAYFIRIEGRRWNIMLQDNCMLLFPQDSIEASLLKAQEFIKKHKTAQFLRLDFRNLNRVVVQLR